ncbi:peptidase [Streptomyces lunaelactis]|uniref:Peptidase n=1 Tax=Streptomyces lunaelactis TaxID=1535768 RepID=A0A2R4T9D5_9ACTN|nr:M23 family metallopeptidase [Streptomyces lunaelactis]AVZ75739.1 peptidase [Streptomyces lunaelactis]NUK02450.1 M23 family metallopeptidase [Streptomyces lunaelactis]NUK09359.1 M23 family metallopeptidase [Streptomyces lunaelactis]NUK16295.1 M23 family metallopeptidase [Streptomyces lunaelactis]NUK27961.1 M23 family metallopeptidase [Streptomyces lunaelactis]
MAFTRATGKHRAPGRMTRKKANFAGVAALATTGVIGTLASPALAAETGATTVEDTGLTQIVAADSLADQIADQAAAQKQEAAEAAAKAKAEAEAKRKAEARAKEAREAKERAAREAERKRLNSFVSPISGSYVSTGYQAGGAVWSSGSHTGIDFHAASGTSVHAVGLGTVVEAGWGGAYGNNVVIKMNDGSYTQYGHLSSISVSVGQSVTPGQRIGLSGATGNTSGPHLHFEARTSPEYGSDINPLAYLRAHGVNV